MKLSIAFLFLWHTAVSINDVVAIDNILCPGQTNDHYCDCTGDCTEKPEWCLCAEAQECCDKNPFQSLSDSFINKVILNSGGGDDTILCPGQPSGNYCDCEGDCTGNPGFCACEEAQACCKGATPVVFCPNQPKENYCDCTGDCTGNFCACAEGRACCAEHASKGQFEHASEGRFVLILLGGVVAGSFVSLLIQIWNLMFRNKKGARQGASLSKAAAKAVSPASSSSSKSDEEVTIASTECRDV